MGGGGLLPGRPLHDRADAAATLGRRPGGPAPGAEGEDRHRRGFHTQIVTALGGTPAFFSGVLASQTAALLAGELDERARLPVIVIDEAHLLANTDLEALRMLTNADMDTGSHIAVLLIGQPTLRRRLKLAVLAAPDQRISTRYTIPSSSASNQRDTSPRFTILCQPAANAIRVSAISHGERPSRADHLGSSVQVDARASLSPNLRSRSSNRNRSPEVDATAAEVQSRPNHRTHIAFFDSRNLKIAHRLLEGTIELIATAAKYGTTDQGEPRTPLAKSPCDAFWCFAPPATSPLGAAATSSTPGGALSGPVRAAAFHLIVGIGWLRRHTVDT